MTSWFLVLLGLFTYVIVRNVLSHITRVPVWLLWLILMAPAIIWELWTIIYGSTQSPPLVFIVACVFLSVFLCWILFISGNRGQRNRETRGENAENRESTSISNRETEQLPVRPIEIAEETNLRNCFPWSLYYIHSIEYRPQAVICRGQLRGNPQETYQQIKTNIEREFADRFLVIFQEGADGKPFFVLIPNKQGNRQDRQKDNLRQGFTALTLLILTLVTTTGIGVQIAGIQAGRLQADWSLMIYGLPYALGLMTILGIHELGHYFTAKLYRINSTLPYFIPVPFFLGTFGAFIQIKSPIPNRKALFDVGIAGPLAGFLVTLPLLLWGLANSEIVTISQQTGILNPDALNPRYSILLALLSKLALGNQLTATSALDLHPIAVAGLLGLIVTALNLMPVGQLDGGHIVHAMFGQRTAMLIGQLSRFFLLILSFIRQEFLFWAIMLLFIPLVDEPALNDITELDNKRDFLGLMAIALLLIIVLPIPDFFARILQI